MSPGVGGNPDGLTGYMPLSPEPQRSEGGRAPSRSVVAGFGNLPWEVLCLQGFLCLLCWRAPCPPSFTRDWEEGTGGGGLPKTPTRLPGGWEGLWSLRVKGEQPLFPKMTFNLLPKPVRLGADLCAGFGGRLRLQGHPCTPSHLRALFALSWFQLLVPRGPVQAAPKLSSLCRGLRLAPNPAGRTRSLVDRRSAAHPGGPRGQEGRRVLSQLRTLREASRVQSWRGLWARCCGERTAGQGLRHCGPHCLAGRHLVGPWGGERPSASTLGSGGAPRDRLLSCARLHPLWSGAWPARQAQPPGLALSG